LLQRQTVDLGYPKNRFNYFRWWSSSAKVFDNCGSSIIFSVWCRRRGHFECILETSDLLNRQEWRLAEAQYGRKFKLKFIRILMTHPVHLSLSNSAISHKIRHLLHTILLFFPIHICIYKILFKIIFFSRFLILILITEYCSCMLSLGDDYYILYIYIYIYIYIYPANKNGLKWINSIEYDKYHFLIRGNGIKSHRKYIKLTHILFSEMLKMNMKKKSIFSVNVNVDVK